MSDLPVVRVAAVQATPVILDLAASVAKAIALVAEAAAQGARLVVFPEAFLSVYPSYAWAHLPTEGAQADEFWERFWSSSVAVGGQEVAALVAACREYDVVVAMGVNEREDDRPGTVYNTLLLVGPDGLLSRHRKLMPTYHERLFHGAGAGDDLEVVETSVGRIGGLICWENRMPLARWAVYQGGPQIWVAPTADDSDGWLATVRHIAIEAGAYVVSVPQYIPRSAFPPDFPWPLPDHEVLGRGGAAIVAPASGDLLGGPLYDAEGIVVAECDLRETLRAKRWFDVAGHYSRADVLWPRGRS
jgi:predicted amidohydrolase